MINGRHWSAGRGTSPLHGPKGKRLRRVSELSEKCLEETYGFEDGYRIDWMTDMIVVDVIVECIWKAI